MKLTIEQIKNITFGALEYSIENEGIDFYRMPNLLSKRIDTISNDFGQKSYATAGIRFDFNTNSDFFAFSYSNVKKASSRTWYYFSLLINGKQVALIGENDLVECKGYYQILLPKGQKRITLFFPNLCRASIQSVELSDGCYFERIKTKNRFVFYGDSITQGYDAKSAANSYVNRVAYKTDAEIYNYAIGGAAFNERMIDDISSYSVDKVFVAYGTNDWFHGENMETFSNHCEKFLSKLSLVYKNTPIYVILPIWRNNYKELKPVGTFFEAREKIAKLASNYDKIKIIDLFDVIPHDLSLYSDGLHPIDDGYVYYTQGIVDNLI